MLRWRCGFVLAILILLPSLNSKLDDDEYEGRGDEAVDENDDEDKDREDDQSEKQESFSGRRVPDFISTPKVEVTVTTTTKKMPLECYVCAYKAETPIRACLDPVKYRVHTITCHSLEDKCFTSIISKDNNYEALVRGCRSDCVGTTETTCCELNRCNDRSFTAPVIAPRALVSSDKATKPVHPNIVLFVTVLLVLQTVVKVTFV